MALSYVQYQGNGSQQTFAIPFPYLDKSHIEVRVALNVTPFTWDDPQTIRISPAPAAGAVIEARRITPRDNRMVDFVDGSVLTESDLDLNAIQTFYIVQEAIDIAGGTLELLPDGSYGAGGRRIKNVGTAIEPRDAVTKEYHDGTWIPQMQALLDTTKGYRDNALTYMNAAEASKNAAAASASAAATSEANALASKNAAATSASNAATSASNASTSASNAASSATTAGNHKTAAETAKTAAETARDTTLGYRNEAQGFRNEAETFKNQAAASAAAAATFDPASYVPKTGGAFIGGISAPQVTVGDNGLVMGYGGKMRDVSGGGTNGAGRTIIQANNDSFEVLTEDGNAFIMTARHGDVAPTFKGELLATRNWATGQFVAKTGYRVHNYFNTGLNVSAGTTSTADYAAKSAWLHILPGGIPSDAIIMWQSVVYVSADGNTNSAGDAAMNVVMEIVNTAGTVAVATGNGIQFLFASPISGAAVMRGNTVHMGAIGASGYNLNGGCAFRVAWNAVYSGNNAYVYSFTMNGVVLVPA